MPAPHDHEEWQERETAGNNAWKKIQKTWATTKRKATDAEPSPKEKGWNLSLSKIFKASLATQVVLSDSEANNLIKKFMNAAFDDASKY